jgi:hypothetical protein
MVSDLLLRSADGGTVEALSGDVGSTAGPAESECM